MSATSDTQTGSTDPLNVYVAALGLIANDRYVKNLDALANRAEEAVKSIAGLNGRRVDLVSVRGNYALTQALQDRMDTNAHPDVEHNEHDWRRFLDDSAVEYDGGDREIPAIMQEDEHMIGEIMAESDQDFDIEAMAEALDQFTSAIDTDADDEPLDDFDADEDDFILSEHVDLRIREHRNEIPMNEVVDVEDREEGEAVLTQQRINRAKSKALGKTDEGHYNDFEGYSMPTVDAVVFLHDGSDRGMEAVEAARGQNPWVKYPSSCDGNVLEVSCNRDEDSIIDWERYLLETGNLEADDLTDGQIEELREIHSDEDLEYMGIEAESDSSEPETPDPASAGAPTPASAD